MKALFIAGTDTGAGKTVVTGCLAWVLQQKGYRVATQKWVRTGSRRHFSSDIAVHLAPYVLITACSPHLAARIENKKIDKHKIIKSFKFLSAHFDFVLVEGTGGILVPFSSKGLLIDIVKELGLPVLVVAENKLGAINHTLLTLEALKRRALDVLGVVFNNIGKQDKKILEDNPRIVAALSGCEVLGVLPRRMPCGRLRRDFVPIADKILKKLL